MRKTHLEALDHDGVQRAIFFGKTAGHGWGQVGGGWRADIKGGLVRGVQKDNGEGCGGGGGGGGGGEVWGQDDG